MNALFRRELVVMTRRPAFTVAACALVLSIAGFPVAWPIGVSLYSGATLLPQLLVIQQLALAVSGPWVVFRCGTRERGDDLVHLALFAAVRPSTILMARFLAAVIALCILAAITAPVILFAQQMAAADVVMLEMAAIRSLAVITTAVAWALICEQSLRSYTGAWLASTLATLALVAAAAIPEAPFGRPILVAASLAALLAVVRRADMTSRYLAEGSA